PTATASRKRDRACGCSARASRSCTRCLRRTSRPSRASSTPLTSPSTSRRARSRATTLWIGGGGEKVTLKLVAQYGDACNVGLDPELCRHKLQVLKDHCENLGRDYGEIIKSAELDAIILNDGDDADAIRENLLFDYTIVGKAQEIRDYVQRLVDAGIDYIIVYLPGVATNHDLISQFESEVIAHFAS